MTPTGRPAVSGAWPRAAVVAILSGAAVSAVLSPVSPVVRAAVVVCFLVAAPGLALVGLLGIPDVWREVALAVGASLAIDVVVIGILVYAGVGDALVALWVLVGLACTGALLQVLHRPRGRHRAEASP